MTKTELKSMRRILSVTFIAVLLCTQIASVIHAAQHNFEAHHHYGYDCAIAHVFEHTDYNGSTQTPSCPAGSPELVLDGLDYPTFIQRSYRTPLIRAPPLFS